MADRVFGLTEAEHRRTVEQVLGVNGRDGLLDRAPVRARPIGVRAPLADPLHHLQARSSAGTPERASAARAASCACTMNGIAAGSRVTCWPTLAPVLAPGTPAPTFTLPDERGEPVSLDDLRGRWVLLWWYPKAATPG